MFFVPNLNSKLYIPFVFSSVCAGFPSPATDYIDKSIDLNEYIVKHPAATFYVRSSGDSMVGAGIHNGDILVVDRSLKATNGKIVVAIVDGEFTVKRFLTKNQNIMLAAENELYRNIHIDAALERVEISDVWGIGRQYAKKLQQLGIYFASDFIQQDEVLIKKYFTINGLNIARELKGISCIDFQLFYKPKKSIIVSRSFGKLLTEFDDIYTALANHIGIACRKLRLENLEAQYLCVYLSTHYHKADFYSDTINIRLPYYSNFTPDFLKYAQIGLKKIFKEHKKYKKCGVVVFDLKCKSMLPSNLFDFRNLQKESELLSVIDKVNNLCGASTINFGDMFLNEEWKPHKGNVTQKFTTSIKELLICK